MSLPPRAGVVVGTWPAGVPDGPTLLGLARQVEDSGFSLLFAGDHLFGNTPSADALTTLAAFAGVTQRVTLGTAVLLLGLREPAVVAKQAATVDMLSGGRLVLGVGVGGEVAQEWQAMEVPAAERGARTDEYLELLRALWSGEPVHHDGRFRRVDGVTGSPAPAQPGGPPVWIGGRTPAALVRAARHDGWCAYAMSPKGLRERLERLDEHFPAGRPPGYRVAHVLFATAAGSVADARRTAGDLLRERYATDLDAYLDAFCALGPRDALAERVAAYREAGAQDVLFSIQAPLDQLPWQIEALAEACAA